MVVDLYSKYGNAERFADIFLLFLTVLFLSWSILLTSLHIDFMQNIKQCEYCIVSCMLYCWWFQSFACFYRLEDAIDKKTVQTKLVTITQTLVDGKVVSESTDVKSSEEQVI